MVKSVGRFNSRYFLFEITKVEIGRSYLCEETQRILIFEKLVEEGWRFVPAQTLNRESLSEPMLENNLASALKRINRKTLTSGCINRIPMGVKVCLRPRYKIVS